MSGPHCDRREFLKTTAVAAGASALPLLAPRPLRSAPAKRTAPVSIARWLHSAALLASGQVVVISGKDDANPLAGVERYDPAANTWTASGR